MIFGTDYYPEQWTPQDWEEDIRLMKEMGLTQVRLAEFAWALMEPKPGKYDFSFFKKIMDLCHSHNMGVILGTPTATFPPWLVKKYPGMVQVSKDGIVRVIGTRRQACFASNDYLKASQKIVEAMSKALGKHPALVGWQIDNEPGHEGSDLSYSPAALLGFRKWLQSKYKTTQKLNQAWGSVFWGIMYNDWSEIPLPAAHVASGFSPSMIQDFYRFNSDILVSFVNMQTKILRKNSSGIPITTNLYPSPFLPITDMAELFEGIDYVSWDNYPVWGPQPEPFPHPLVAATLQYSRGLKNKSFTVMEEFSGQQGHDTVGYLPPPGQIGLWMCQAIAHGASQIFFFRYRTALFGQEQLCYGILDHSKQITHKYKELQKTIAMIREAAEDFAEEDYSADVVVVSDIDNSRNYKHQPLSEGLKFSPVDFAKVGYDIEIATWYAGASVLNASTHLRPSTKVNLKDYKVCILPLYTMFDDDFVAQVEDFVRSGGVLVLGYRAGIMDKNHWMIPERTPGKFKEMAGVEVERFDSVGTGSVKIKFRILPGKCGKFCELLEPTTAKPIAWYNDSKKFYKGTPVVTVNQFGTGKVYYVGASLTPESFVLLYRRIFRESNVDFRFLGAHVEKIQRKGKNKNYTIYMNHRNKASWCLDGGVMRLKPYEVRVVNTQG
ncbi:MAG: beta-galactosidase [Leptospira sp.]|nr:beta-galactosidase [Leptospira sp.]